MKAAWAYMFAVAPLIVSVMRGRDFTPSDLASDILLGLMIACLVTVLRTQQTRLVEMSALDSLTSCYTVRRFTEELPLAVARAARSGRPLTLLYADLDNFKPINDKFGHAKGNEVLTQFARCLKACIRAKVDLAYRIGGDEFAVVLTDAGLDSAAIVGGRIQSAIAAEPKSLKSLGVTVSIGAVALRESEAADAFLRRADAAMYEAKRGGKDRVKVA